jgi:hypothetical protein
VFCLAIDVGKQVEFNIVPYYLVAVNATHLTLPSPNMKHNKIIALFKQQGTGSDAGGALNGGGEFFQQQQGLPWPHAITSMAHSNNNNYKSKDGASQQPIKHLPLQLYNPNFKIGTLRASKTTCGPECKKLPLEEN